MNAGCGVLGAPSITSDRLNLGMQTIIDGLPLLSYITVFFPLLAASTACLYVSFTDKINGIIRQLLVLHLLDLHFQNTAVAVPITVIRLVTDPLVVLSLS